MNRQYDDLLALTDRKPSFFQQGGVPRWADFRPGESTGIYAVDCAIVEIACQLCDTRFHVLMESDSRDRSTILERIRSSELSYRDPPNVNCCPGGASTTSETVRVLEYWAREQTFQWRRDPSAEVAFRRMGDPWTPEMRTRADALLADEGTEEDVKTSIRESLAAEDARIAEGVRAPDPVYATDYRSAT